MYIKYLILFFLVSCAPHMTYDELIVAERTEVDPKEHAEIERKIERFEDDALASNDYFTQRETCGQNKGHFWYCYNAAYSNSRLDQILENDPTLEQRVRIYRRMRGDCGCAAIRDFENVFK